MRGALVTFLLTTGLLFAGPQVYADKPDDKGKDKDKPAQSQGGGRESAPGQQEDRTPPGQADRTPPGQAERGPDRADRQQERADRGPERAAEAAANRVERAEAKAENRADRAEARSERAAEASVERQHPHQDRNAQARADRELGGTNGQDKVRVARAGTMGRGGDHAVRGRDGANAQVDGLLKSLNKLEHARWSYNPHDTRGQGNMGKVDMRNPFGFDKDSGREGADRGRPIRETEPTLDLASIVSVDFGSMDWVLAWYAEQLEYWRQLAALYPDSIYPVRVMWLERNLAYYQAYFATIEYDYVAVNQPLSIIDYTMNLTALEGTEGEILDITTSLISVNDYSAWTYDEATGTWKYVTYTAGQTVYTETSQATLGTDSSYTFSYDPPDSLAGYSGGYFQLSVTVSDADGQSYTTTYDRLLYLYRCPYGIIYDQTTGKAIAGATVTVHTADGSVVVLDKASNPNVSNPQTTDATGRYNAKLAIGQKYYLSVTAPGYEEYKSPLFSERWHIVREDVGLTPVKHAAIPTPSPVLDAPAPRGAEELGAGIPGFGVGSGFIIGK